jgi:phosphatidylinositol dimannoside acyltransferase
MRYSPPFFGLAAAALLPSARRAISASLRRTRGSAGPVRDAIDVARTFATYAGALAEGLASGSKNAQTPRATVHGERHLEGLRRGVGAVVVTAHTAGWEIVGPMLSSDTGAPIMLAMQAERDERARALHDESRRARGLQVAHVGGDPLASLPLLRHVRGGGVAALQLDRIPPGMRAREVRLFGAPGKIPEGPLRIAQLAGVPILPIFCARLGFNAYEIEISAPVDVPRRASPAELDSAAQTIADAMTRFLRAHPTQWLTFHGDEKNA